jgi:hypothetical protein
MHDPKLSSPTTHPSAFLSFKNCHRSICFGYPRDPLKKGSVIPHSVYSCLQLHAWKKETQIGEGKEGEEKIEQEVLGRIYSLSLFDTKETASKMKRQIWISSEGPSRAIICKCIGKFICGNPLNGRVYFIIQRSPSILQRSPLPKKYSYTIIIIIILLLLFLFKFLY